MRRRSQRGKHRTHHRARFSVDGGIYCPRAHKSKQFFTTEQEAEDYILANAEIIRRRGGYAPMHTYYCEACGGWHISSKR